MQHKIDNARKKAQLDAEDGVKRGMTQQISEAKVGLDRTQTDIADLRKQLESNQVTQKFLSEQLAGLETSLQSLQQEYDRFTQTNKRELVRALSLSLSLSLI